jgi:hypothetical protein
MNIMKSLEDGYGYYSASTEDMSDAKRYWWINHARGVADGADQPPSKPIVVSLR